MLVYTRATLDKIVTDIKRFTQFFTLATLLFSIGYMVYAMAAGVGILWVNIVLCAISAGYLILYLVTLEKRDRTSKDVKRYGKRTYKCIKLILKAYTIGLSVYGIYIASADANGMAIILALINLVVWGIQVLLELVSLVVIRYKDLLIASIQADIETVTKPARAVVDFAKKITGQEQTPEAEPIVKRTVLDSIALKFKDKMARKKEEEKARNQSAKQSENKSSDQQKEPISK